MGDEPSPFEKWATTAVEPTVGQQAVRREERPRRIVLVGLAFYVTGSSSPLPVQIDLTNPGNAEDHGTIVLSRWGEPLSITPPPNPIPITSLTG